MVLGLGNLILSDDGVGFQVVEQLKARLNQPEITLMEADVSGLGLLDLLVGYDRAIIIDAIQTEGGKAGEVYHLGIDGFAASRRGVSPHDVDLATALELGKRLGLDLPQQIAIIAIEVADVITFREGCTPEVERAIPLAAKAVIEECTLS